MMMLWRRHAMTEMQCIQFPRNSNRCLYKQTVVINSYYILQFSSVQSLSRVRLFVTPMNCSTPGLPVHHQLLESTQTHIHRVSDAIQPSHPLLSPSPPAPNPSQHQSLFSEATLLMRWPKYWSFSFSIIPSNEHQDWSPLEWAGWISLQSRGLSRVFSNTTVQKHQLFSAHFLHSPSLTSIHDHWKNHD